MTTINSPEKKYQKQRISHWERIADQGKRRFHLGNYYHKRIQQVFRFNVPPGLNVLEIGCGNGDLLAALSPSNGVGIDFSEKYIRRARTRHPTMRFYCVDCHDLSGIEEKFDIIILSDLVNDLWDVQSVFGQLFRLSHFRTRIIINFYSRLWEIPLAIAERLGLANPNLDQNWLTNEDVVNLLDLSGFERIRTWSEIIWPVNTLILEPIFNRFLVKIWPFKHLALTNFVVARPRNLLPVIKEPMVSVVIAARNESGNISQIFQRLPRMGSETEIIFVEGHSTDNTFETIKDEIKRNDDWSCQLYKQQGEGKGDAIRLGFEKASGDVLIILDADLTVPPEDLPRFYNALVKGKGDFVNGVRLVYPMETQAMRFLNLLGNKFFSLAFSWLLGQPIKDTLCGTKVLWNDDYRLIRNNREYFGNFDPFGDFDLLFGAAKLDLKIVDLPIRYRQRVYGETNIDRWKHGILLIRMAINAARYLKFV